MGWMWKGTYRLDRVGSEDWLVLSSGRCSFLRRLVVGGPAIGRSGEVLLQRFAPEKCVCA